ncbi:hypothetical protein [Halomonas piscis]|uniref:hypothetical protein n=1 Tax=Halomonas piscis TaxID=3031727 RepID=UPI0028A00AFD|nr:hypothetical protein [Halomonas piscis]
MIKSLALRFAPWVLLAAALYAGATYVQHINNERDAIAADLEQSREEVSVWKEQHQWQQELLNHLVDAMDERTKALESATESIDASRRALNRIGAEHAEIREWMDGDVPVPVSDWLRVLQEPGTGAQGSMPNDSRAADDATKGAER